MDDEIREENADPASLDMKILIVSSAAGAVASVFVGSEIPVAIHPVSLGAVALGTAGLHYVNRFRERSLRWATLGGRYVRAAAYGGVATGMYAVGHEVAEGIINMF